MRRWFPRMLGAYLVAAFAATSAPGYEVFPFFCWFLFPVAPNQVERYALLVEELAGRPVDPPRSFQKMHLVAEPHAMDAWTSVQALGRAVEAQDEARIRMLRTRIEMNFLPPPSRVVLVKRRFDPLVRYKTGRIDAETRLAVFTSSHGCSEIPWAR